MLRKISVAAACGFALIMFVAIFGADGFMDMLGPAKFLGLYAVLLGLAAICVFLSKEYNLRAIRRIYRRFHTQQNTRINHKRAAF